MAKHTKAGSLRHRVTLQTRAAVQDPVTGEMSQAWAAIATVWAAIEPGRATPQPYGSPPAVQTPALSPAPYGHAPLLRGPGAAPRQPSVSPPRMKFGRVSPAMTFLTMSV